jgi:replicative DNA helicase Mcm
MNESDRSSMHEAMEQQRISVSKAGINATLRTRCAVLAAANPKNGRFESVSRVPFTNQVNLAPPLLSRFDIIWLLTDSPSKDQDQQIANHIISTRIKGTSELLIEDGSASNPENTLNQTISLFLDEYGDEIIGRDTIRKYVALAKRTVHPELTTKAKQALVDFYVKTRMEGGEYSDSIAITARALEAMARLAEASARIRLSQKAEMEDVERAIRLTRTWRHMLMGDNYDETSFESGKSGTARNRLRSLHTLVERLSKETEGNGALLTDILEQGQKLLNIEKDTLQDMIDKEVLDGALYRPNFDRVDKA